MRPASACLPDELGRHVLHAALDEPEDAAAAWAQCRPHLDLSPHAATTELHRLLPLVWRNLAAAPIDDADRTLLRGHYDRTLAANEQRVTLAGRWIALLDLGGVSTCVLKGLSLALRCYGDLGVRPMTDIDLLVPVEQADRALDLLEGAGWREAGGCTRKVLWRINHGSQMVHPDGGSIDVHWYIAGFLVDPVDERASSAPFWTRLEPLTVGNRPTATLDHTDTLVHVCLHGLWAGSAATTRWVTDVVTLLRVATSDGRSTIDGDRVLEMAERYKVGRLLHDAIEYAVEEHRAPVPVGLVDGLAAQRVGWRVRRRQMAVTASPEPQELLRGLAHLRAYWAYTRWGWSDTRAARALPTFLVTLWSLERPRQLPLALLTRSWRRLRR